MTSHLHNDDQNCESKCHDKISGTRTIAVPVTSYREPCVTGSKPRKSGLNFRHSLPTIRPALCSRCEGRDLVLTANGPRVLHRPGWNQEESFENDATTKPWTESDAAGLCRDRRSAG